MHTTILTFPSVLLQEMLKCRANNELVIKCQLAGRLTYVEPFRFSSIVLHCSYLIFSRNRMAKANVLQAFKCSQYNFVLQLTIHKPILD